MKILKLVPPSGKDVTFIVNVCASRLEAPSATTAASRTKGQALGPATKSLQNSTVDDVGSGRQATLKSFTLNASNSTSPLENWNLTALAVKSAAFPV